MGILLHVNEMEKTQSMKQGVDDENFTVNLNGIPQDILNIS